MHDECYSMEASRNQTGELDRRGECLDRMDRIQNKAGQAGYWSGLVGQPEVIRPSQSDQRGTVELEPRFFTGLPSYRECGTPRVTETEQTTL